MALELTAGIDASEETIAVTGTVPAEIGSGYVFSLGDEILTLRLFEMVRRAGTAEYNQNRNSWICSRGRAGSTAVSHLAAVSVLGVSDASVAGTGTAEPEPIVTSGGGGGAVDSVNGQTGVVELTLAQTLAAGNDTGGLGIVNVAPVDTAANASATATSDGTGSATASRLAEALGAGNALARSDALANNDGYADAALNAQAFGAGLADARQVASSSSGDTYVLASATSGGTGNADATTAATSVDGAADVSAAATTSGDGAASAARTATAGGIGDATATTTATSVDGTADTSSTATASGTGNANLQRFGTTVTGDIQAQETYDVDHDSDASTDATLSLVSAGSGIATGDVTTDHYVAGSLEAGTSLVNRSGPTGGSGSRSQYDVTQFSSDGGNVSNQRLGNATGGDGSVDFSDLADAVGGGQANTDRRSNVVDGTALSRSRAFASGTGDADVTAVASAAGGSASFGPVANATRANILCNDVTLFTKAASAPGGTFISLFYRDTTAVTGRMYMWDFATEAYEPISGVF